ncbi:polysaccharide deacetylase family protein [Algoriphagus namhaensis]
MKKLLFILFSLSLINFSVKGQSLTERLGYDKNDKLLIIHADDLGLSHGKNQATFKAMTGGVVNSASIMMTCPWVAEVGKMYESRPELDLGLHLTLTNEWFLYKWGTVSDQAAAGLENDQGYMHADCATVAIYATEEQVKMEITAQVEQALALGIRPTHLDSHMGCLFFGRPEYLRAYLQVAQAYGIPAMVEPQMVTEIIEANPEIFQEFDLDSYPVVDAVLTASPQDFEKGMTNYYTSVLNELNAGVNVLLIHVAYDDLEMQGITDGHRYWHAPWRQADFDFFTSPEARQLLEANDIKLVTWRQIGELL